MEGFQAVLKDLKPLFSLTEKKWCRGLNAVAVQMGGRVGMELRTHSCIMCLGAHPHHTMLMYMFCAERAKRLQSPDKCAPAVSHCATL